MCAVVHSARVVVLCSVVVLSILLFSPILFYPCDCDLSCPGLFILLVCPILFCPWCSACVNGSVLCVCRGCRSGDDRKTKTNFCGECWSCGGWHRIDKCDIRWKRQVANSARRLVQAGKDNSRIAGEEIMGQVRRPKQPGPAAVEVVELPRPRPRPKAGGGGELASVHAVAEERRPKRKTKTETKTEEAEAEHATHRQEEEGRWAAKHYA